MPPRVAPVQLVGINIPNSKLSADERLGLQNKVLPRSGLPSLPLC